MSKHWNDEMIELEKRDNLTSGQTVVGMEGWDLRWEIERLQKIVAKRESEITALRFDNAMLKAELNSIRGKR
jgi:predicted kinase